MIYLPYQNIATAGFNAADAFTLEGQTKRK